MLVGELPDLADAIRSAALHGRLQDLSLYRLGHEWQANLREEQERAWLVCIDEDPVAALLQGLLGIAKDGLVRPGRWFRGGALARLEYAVDELAFEIRRMTRHGNV